MRLDITEILREVGKNLPYDIHEAALVDEDTECTKPIEGRINFNNTGGTLLVTGKATTAVALPCGRCSEYFERPVTLNIEESFELRHSGVGPRNAQNVEVLEEDESPIAGKLFDGHVFDLTEMLRQYILLDEPTQPLPPTQRTASAPIVIAAQRMSHIEAPAEAEETTAEQTSINPAFAKLSELLNKNDNN